MPGAMPGMMPMMGGLLDLKSYPGEGASFSIALPVGRVVDPFHTEEVELLATGAIAIHNSEIKKCAVMF